MLAMNTVRVLSLLLVILVVCTVAIIVFDGASRFRPDEPAQLAAESTVGVGLAPTAAVEASAPTEVPTPEPVPPATPTAASTPSSGEDADPVLVGAGDISSCRNLGDEVTATLLESIPGTVMSLGNNVSPSGSLQEFQTCYDQTWGRHKARIRPAMGNIEYKTPGGEGYFAYFGAAAGEPGRGYYSYELGAWHIVVLNSNCKEVGGCDAGSPQEQWLRADLAAHPTRCTLAYWHHPLFSSSASDIQRMRPIWQVLYEAGADVIVSSHARNYERFAPQNPDGGVDPARGIRQFVAGTGGSSLNPIETPIANSEVHNDDTYGVLKLTLHAESYDWKFVPQRVKTFTDEGSEACH
jgi:hypothetical protein